MATKITILKFNNLGKPLWNRLYMAEFLDKMYFTELLDVDFPLFKYESETVGTVKKRKAGDFAITFSYISNTLSYSGNNIMQFLRGGTNAYLFWLSVELNGTVFSGTFSSPGIISDFTFTNGKYEGTILVKDMLFDWSSFAATRDCVFNISPSSFPNFEDYAVTHHLNQLVYDTSQVITPTTSLEARCGQNVKFLSDFYRAIGGMEGGTVYTDWQNVNRLETWEGLSRGLGFDYDIELNDSIDNIYNDFSATTPIDKYYNIVIKWKEDIYNEEPSVITECIVHRETIIPKSKKNIFIGYRHHIYPGLSYYTIINGILYSNDFELSIDNLSSVAIDKPYFQIDTGRDYVHWLSYSTVGSNSLTKFVRETEVNEVELELYSCGDFDVPVGSTIHAGAIAYARLFCDPITLGFGDVQKFAVKAYKRYSGGFGLIGKELEVSLDDVQGLKLYKPLLINDGNGEKHYEVDQILGINKKSNTAVVAAIELPNVF